MTPGPAHPTAMELGGSDCESWRAGLLHQPVNSLSSLAFVVAGTWIAAHPADDRAGRLRAAVFGAAVAANGVGSLLYHGPGWPGSTLVHDAAIPAVLLFVAAEDLALLRGWGIRRELTGYSLTVAAGLLSLAAVPAATGPVTGVCAGLAVAAELVLFRRGRPPARTLLPLVVTVVSAAIAGLAGRTGSPFCRPDSLLQGHALWHVLAAGALAAWHRMHALRTRPGG